MTLEETVNVAKSIAFEIFPNIESIKTEKQSYYNEEWVDFIVSLSYWPKNLSMLRRQYRNEWLKRGPEEWIGVLRLRLTSSTTIL